MRTVNKDHNNLPDLKEDIEDPYEMIPLSSIISFLVFVVLIVYCILVYLVFSRWKVIALLGLEWSISILRALGS